MTRPERHAHGESGNRDGGRLGGVVRRLRRSGPTPEERLGEVIEEHRRDLEEQTRRFEETIADLERREQLLSDSRASVERLLRLGTKDLDSRESDVARLVRDLTEREARLRDEEEELARRRSELGAVELKRLAVEQRERALEAREERITSEERRLDLLGAGSHEGVSVAELAFVPGPRYALVEIGPRPVTAGDALAVEGIEYVVTRLGRSPLPGDGRRCAFLVQRERGAPPSAGSS